MRYLSLIIAVFCFSKSLNAQSNDLKEGLKVNIEGVEFFYNSTRVQGIRVNDSAYTYFNVTWYATNNGKFSKIFLLDKEKKLLDPEYDYTRKAYIGKIFVTNGLGSETTKNMDVLCKEPNMEIVGYTKILIGNKRKTIEGYNLQSGQTVKSEFLVAVPKGSVPAVSLQAFLSPMY